MLVMKPDLSLRKRSAFVSGPAPTLSAQVEAMMAGTSSFFVDPGDLSTMWQDSTKTTPVTTAADPVGAIRTKWGAEQFDLIQATAGARPTWTGAAGITFDGVDDLLSADGSFNILNNAPGYFIAQRIAGAVTNSPIAISNNLAATNQRVEIINSSGRQRTRVKRLDADVITDNFGADGSAFTGNTWSFEQDLTLTGDAVKRRNNVQIDTHVHPAPLANSSNTAAMRVRLGASLVGTVMAGTLGRTVVLSFVPTAGQRTVIEALLTEETL